MSSAMKRVSKKRLQPIERDYGYPVNWNPRRERSVELSEHIQRVSDYAVQTVRGARFRESGPCVSMKSKVEGLRR